MRAENGGQLVRLSSSFREKLKGESAPLALGLEYFDKLEVPASAVLFESRVLAGFAGGIIDDLDDFGVEQSILSNPR